MSVLPHFQTQRTQLVRAVYRWDRHARAAVTAVWLPRALIAALIGAVALAILAHARPLLTPAEIALIAVVLCIAASAACLALIWLRREPAERIAVRYDVALNSRARITTAFELIDGRIRSNDELTERQIADAAAWIDQAKPAHAFPIRFRGWEIAAALGLIGVLTLLLVLPNAQTDALAENAAQTAALEAARDQVREITQDVASNSDVNDEAREAVLDALADAQRALDQDDVSREEAFAALTDVQSQLSSAANDLLQQSAQAQSALTQASDRLRQAAGLAPGTQDLSDTLEELAQQMALMDAAQQQAMQNAFQDAAGMMGENSALGDMMTQAAQNLQNGNTQSAQQSAENAAQQAGQQQQGAEQNQRAGEQLEQNAQQAAQAAQQAADSAQNQPGENPAQNESGDQQPQTGDSPPGETNPQAQQADPNQTGSQPGEPQNQAGDSAAGQPESDAPSAMQDDPAQAGGGEQDPASQASSGAGSGMGDQAADSNALQSPFQGDGTESSNNPDGQGESEYAPIYAPSRIGGEQGDDQIFLESDDSNVPSVEGEFSPNPAGQSTVPYNQVFGQYSTAANQALNQNRIPLSLRDVVRNYFSSLEPDN